MKFQQFGAVEIAVNASKVDGSAAERTAAIEQLKVIIEEKYEDEMFKF